MGGSCDDLFVSLVVLGLLDLIAFISWLIFNNSNAKYINSHCRVLQFLIKKYNISFTKNVEQLKSGQRA